MPQLTKIAEGGSIVRVHSGLANIRAFIAAVNEGGSDRWSAFHEHLYLPYREVWDAWFPNFGWCLPESAAAKNIVNGLNLIDCEKQIDRFLDDAAEDLLCSTLEEAEGFCPAGSDAGAFLLLGFGRTDGCVVPTDRGAALFLGIDAYPSAERFADVVAHEYNHVVRLSASAFVPGNTTSLMSSVTVGDLTIAEGLAVVFPLCLRGQRVTEYAASDAGFLAREDVEAFLSNEDETRDLVLRHWDSPLSEDLMLELFANLGDGPRDIPPKAAYFIGTRIVERLVNAGHCICELTKWPASRFHL